MVEACGAFLRGNSQSDGVRRESRVGIVLSEQDAVFSAGGKHTVRFVNAFRDEVIDEYADIGFVAVQHEGVVAGAFQCGVDASDDALPGSFFISRGSVHLSGEEKAVEFLRFQRMAQLRRLEEIIFDGVAWAVDLHIAEARNLFQRFQLDVERQAR